MLKLSMQEVKPDAFDPEDALKQTVLGGREMRFIIADRYQSIRSQDIYFFNYKRIGQRKGDFSREGFAVYMKFPDVKNFFLEVQYHEKKSWMDGELGKSIKSSPREKYQNVVSYKNEEEQRTIVLFADNEEPFVVNDDKWKDISKKKMLIYDRAINHYAIEGLAGHGLVFWIEKGISPGCVHEIEPIVRHAVEIFEIMYENTNDLYFKL